MSEPEDLPTARRAPAPPRRGAWLPISALLLAAYLAADVWRSQGPRITVHAEQGFGLAEGDPLRYRGTDVGRIEDIELAPDLSGIRLTLRVEPDAEALCREGTRFWVVRPEVSVDSVSGLDTLVGARYLSVDPGPLDGPASYEFHALSAPPAAVRIEDGGLLVRLEASARGGLAPGAQLTFRGVPVGVVLDTRLASDASGVEIDAYLEPAHAGLVRSGTRFWRTGGLSVSVALTGGISVEADSLRELVVGGIALATPDEAGGPVEDGATFELLESAPAGADRWRPSLLMAAAEVSTPDPGRHLVPVELSYERGRLLTREVRRAGWAVALPGALLLPAELARAPEAREGTAVLRVDGREVAPAAFPWEGDGLVLLSSEHEGEALGPSEVELGPALEDCVVLVPDEPPRPLSRARLTPAEGGWRIDRSVATDGWPRGALVHGRDSGRFVGVLVSDGDGARVAPFHAEHWSAQGR